MLARLQRAAMLYLTSDIMESLCGYAFASKWERFCLYAIAARTRPADLEKYQPVFQEVANGDRWITRADIVHAFLSASRWCSHGSAAEADAFFKAADLNGDAALTFTEFVAACLYSTLGPLDGWLARETFTSLDKDGDGFVHPREALELFGQLPSGLSKDRPFDENEWCACLLRHSAAAESKGLWSMLPSIPSCKCEGGFVEDDEMVSVIAETSNPVSSALHYHTTCQGNRYSTHYDDLSERRPIGQLSSPSYVRPGQPALSSQFEESLDEYLLFGNRSRYR